MLISEVVRELRGLAVELQRAVAAETDPSVLALSDEARRAAAELVEVKSQIEAAHLELLASMERTRAYRHDGATGLVGWLADQAHVSRGEAARQAKTATWMAKLPAMAALLARGAVTGTHLAVVLKACQRVANPQVVGVLDAQLARHAPGLVPKDLAKLAQQAVNLINPDAQEVDARQQYEARYLHVSTALDGMVAIDGLLDPESGAWLKTALDGASRPPAERDTRTAAQRRADDFVGLMRLLVRSGELGDKGGVPVQVVVHADLRTLTSPPARLDLGLAPFGLANDIQLAAAVELLERVVVSSPAAPTLGDAAITPSALLRICCEVSISRVLTRGGSEILDVGRGARVANRAIRRAVDARDRGCRFPGCGRPPSWCQAHHIKHWAHGGHTKLDELVSLCDYHHRLLHHHGWRIERRTGGALVFIDPWGASRVSYPRSALVAGLLPPPEQRAG